MARIALLCAVVAVSMSACGGGSTDGRESKASPKVSARPSPTATVRPVPQAERRVHVINLDRDSCDVSAAGDERLRVLAHEERAKQYVEIVQSALGEAIDAAGSVYGWTPSEPICVHMFSSDNAFLQGLQELAGLAPAISFQYRAYVGTVGIDLATGLDAIYMNTVFPFGDNGIPFLATHEYFHIVQGHVGGTSGGAQQAFPSWFLEGMADWEAVKLQGSPHHTWLQVLITEERLGRMPPLSELVSWDQWSDIERRSPRYWKARGALAYLEQLAGRDAAARILTENASGSLAGFQLAFEEVSGVTPQEFEQELLPFLEEMLLNQAITPTP